MPEPGVSTLQRIGDGSLPRVGVLGGMGPAATADFHHKLVAATPARRDQDHVPLLIHSIPQIPDRAASILDGADSPAPALVSVARSLQASGAQLIVMPCNTAHFWYDELRQAVQIPVLHIADPVLDALSKQPGLRRVGLLGTRATVAAGLYAKRARQATERTRAIEWVLPGPAQQLASVDAGIDAVKAGHLDRGEWLLREAARQLVDDGADAVVLACTEIPLVLQQAAVPVLDATQLLAEATVHWALQRAGQAVPG